MREALSKLQAAGQVRTRHGIGTFVVGPGEAALFRIAPAQPATLDDVIALLELRIGVETEAAALAAQRRSDTNLRQAARGARRLPARRRGRPRRGGGRLPLPLGIARATRNAHFAGLMAALGETAIPRAARCAGAADRRAARVPEASTPSTTTSSTPSRAATGRGARGDAHALWPTAANAAAAPAPRRWDRRTSVTGAAGAASGVAAGAACRGLGRLYDDSNAGDRAGAGHPARIRHQSQGIRSGRACQPFQLVEGGARQVSANVLRIERDSVSVLGCRS
ncbi:MAG: hypothetical protein U1F25_11580 [Rubrivivax sp.]